MSDRELLWEELLCITEEAFPGAIPVPWEGPGGARLALVGEAPGEQETVLRRPFAGKAGKILDGYLASTGLDRREIYVTNTVKIRPWKMSRAGNAVNRPPSGEELGIYTPYLHRELRLVSPGLIVTLGNVPLHAFLGPGAAIGRLHGCLTQWEGIPLIPMYHPAAVIYDPSKREGLARDMETVAKFIGNQQ